MRSQLFAGGVLVVLLGVLFYAFPLPLVYFWSIPFAVGGGIMMIASFFMSESTGPIKPPEGFRFCVFCTNPVPVTSERCPKCDGLQPKEGA
jgi:hypothetical protein